MRILVTTLAFAGIVFVGSSGSALAAQCSADYILAPDHSALSILFTDLVVEGRRDPVAECSIDVPLDLPEGMSLGVYRVDYRGYASLARKEVATLGVDFDLGPKGNGRNFKRSMRGVTDEEFAFTENIGAGLMKRVGCGVDARLSGNVRLSLEGGSDALATLDSGDGAARRGLVYRFNLKKC
jgi:hypothetical protein